MGPPVSASGARDRRQASQTTVAPAASPTRTRASNHSKARDSPPAPGACRNWAAKTASAVTRQSAASNSGSRRVPRGLGAIDAEPTGGSAGATLSVKKPADDANRAAASAPRTEGPCYDGELLPHARFSVAARAVSAVACVAVALALAGRLQSQGALSPVYTIIASSGRRAVPYRPSPTGDMVPLDQLADFFGATLQEDALAGGVTLLARGQRVALTPGQSMASINGRIVSLSGPVTREGQTWFVPVDLVTRALGPALNLAISVRRASHLIVVGDMQVPQISTRFGREGPNGRLVFDVQPPAAHRVTRQGNHLVITFDADALDALPITFGEPAFVGASRVDGTSLVIDLAVSVTAIQADDANPAHFTIDLLTAPPAGGTAAAAPAPRPSPAAPPPVADLTSTGAVRTVVIDPGHGGDDAGVRGANGAVEKDVTMQVARRLKTAIESRLGLRVLLTRDGDQTVPIDRRAAFANNNKADLLVSLHADASWRPTLRGAQVLSLSLKDYQARAESLGAGAPVPIIGGGTRVIEMVPWDLAQAPHAAQSASLAAIVARHLAQQQVPLYPRTVEQAPLRLLLGANMPAVLVELGFLTNAGDEQALTGNDLPAAEVEALVGAINDVRAGVPTVPPTP